MRTLAKMLLALLLIGLTLSQVFAADYRPGWAGLTVQTITPDLARQFDLKENKGALVIEVAENGPGEKAGLKSGDVIIEFDNKKIEGSNQLRDMTFASTPGRTYFITIIRNQSVVYKQITIGDMLGRRPAQPATPDIKTITGGTPAAPQADEESLGREAEQAGKLREALTHYVSSLQSASEGSSKDQQLREKIISLVQKITPPPAVPDEAERNLARGRAAVKSATQTKDFEDAANEFKRALRAAPWVAEGYYNLGVVQDKAGRYQDAIRSLKLYLLAAPNASDAKEVKALIYEIEFRQEKAQRDAERQQKEVREKAESANGRSTADADERLARDMTGLWQWAYFSGWRVKISSYGKRVTATQLPVYYDSKVGMTKELPFWDGVVRNGRFVGTVYELHVGGSKGIEVSGSHAADIQIDLSGGGRVLEMHLNPQSTKMKFIKE